MAIDAGQGFIDILPRTDKFLVGLNSQVTKAVSTASKNATTTSQKLINGATLGFIALGAAAAAAIGKGIEATTDWASDIRGLQKITGQTAESASGLAGAAEHLGIGVDQLQVGFGALAKNVATASPALAKYGLTVRDASGNMLPFDEILGVVQDKFLSLPSAAEQTAFAMTVFGKSGKALIPILAAGRDGLADFEAAAAAAGLVMSQDDVDAAKALTLAQRDLGSAFKGASISIGKTFLPLATSVVETITKIVSVIQKVPEPVLQTGLGFVVLTGAISGVIRAGEFFTTTWSEVADSLGLAADAATTVESTTSLAAEATRTAADVATIATTATTASAAANTGLAGSNTTLTGTTVALTAALDRLAERLGVEIPVAAAKGAEGLAGFGVAESGLILPTEVLDAQVARTGTTAATSGGFFAGLSSKIGLFASSLKLATLEIAGWYALGSVSSVPILTDLEGLNEQLKTVRATFAAGNIGALGGLQKEVQFLSKAFDANAQAVELAITANISYEEAAARLGLTIDETGRAVLDLGKDVDVTRLAIRAAGVDFDAGEAALQRLGDISGETASQFRESFTTAFEAAAAAAQKAGEDFDGTAAAEEAFATASTDAMERATTAIQDFRESATADLLAFGGDALSGLAEKAHLTVDKITRSFEDAAAATRHFGHDILEISRTGGQAGSDLAAQLLAMGPAAAGLASFIADAGGKAQRSMIQQFGQIGTAADRAAGKITDSIVGTLDDIRTILLAIADKWNVDVEIPGMDKHKQDTADLHHNLLEIGKPFTAIIKANTQQAAAGLKFIKDQISDIEGVHQTSIIISREFRGGGGHAVASGGIIQAAQGGVIAGASGFVTQGPTFLTGESSRMTFAGRGAEAVIPFDQRGIGILSEALSRAMAKAPQHGGDSPDIVVHVHQHLDQKEIGESVTRFQQRGRMVRG